MPWVYETVQIGDILYTTRRWRGPKRQSAGGAAYWQRIKNTQPGSLIGLWRLNEATGSAAIDSSPEANNGTYTGVDLANAAGPDGVAVPYFDGSNDYVNIYSAGLNTDKNLDEFTMLTWIKMQSAGVWTDSTARRAINIQIGTPWFSIYKDSTNNALRCYRRASDSTTKGVITTISSLAWIPSAVVCSVAGDYLKFFVSGAQAGETQTGIHTITGSLSSTQTCLGAASTTPANVHQGWLGPTVWWTTPLSDAEIIALMAV